MSRPRTTTTEEYEQIVLNYIEKHEDCSIWQIMSATNLDYITCLRILRGRNDSNVKSGLLHDDKITCKPGIQNNKLTWIYKIKRE